MASFNTQNGGGTTNTWLTPRWLLDLLGGFDTDPCAAEGRPWDDAEEILLRDLEQEGYGKLVYV